MERLAEERRHLAQADSHIAAGERRVASQMLLIERLRMAGRKTEEAETLLARMRDMLETWNAHRHKILEEITRLRRLPPH